MSRLEAAHSRINIRIEYIIHADILHQVARHIQALAQNDHCR